MTIAKLSGQRLAVPRRYWSSIALISLFNITGWNLLVISGLGLLPSGKASILAFTMPLWGVLLSLWILRESLTFRRALGLALGLSGMIVLLGDDFRSLQQAPIGALLVLAAAMSWALGTVLLKRFSIPLETAALAGWQMLLGGIPIVVAAVLLPPRWGGGFSGPVGLGPGLALAYNMLVCFIFCYWVWFRLVGLVPVSVSALSTLMIPVVGVVSGALILGENPGWQEFGALVLVVTALAVVLLPSRATPISA
jgi:drug/metabolite transporter (DMT)-like permease